MYNFRKMYSETAEKSEYTAIVKTTEDLEKEAAQEHELMEEDSESEAEVKPKKAAESKRYTVDDIMELGTKLSINKKKKAAAKDVPKESDSKGIKKKKHWKKSQRIIKFK